MIPLAEIERAAMRGEIHIIRDQLTSAEATAFQLQREVVDALCQIARLRRCLESYQSSSLHRLSCPLVSAEEACMMDSSRHAISGRFRTPIAARALPKPARSAL